MYTLFPKTVENGWFPFGSLLPRPFEACFDPSVRSFAGYTCEAARAARLRAFFRFAEHCKVKSPATPSKIRGWAWLQIQLCLGMVGILDVGLYRV